MIIEHFPSHPCPKCGSLFINRYVDKQRRPDLPNGLIYDQYECGSREFYSEPDSQEPTGRYVSQKCSIASWEMYRAKTKRVLLIADIEPETAMQSAKPLLETFIHLLDWVIEYEENHPEEFK